MGDIIALPTEAQISVAVRSIVVALTKWTDLCDRQLHFYVDWAFPHGIPGHIGDAWFQYVTQNEWDCWREHGSLDWHEVFRRFADAYLARDPDYRMAIG